MSTASGVDGEATVFMTATGIHQDVVGFLFRVLAWFVEERELGLVRVAPFAIRVVELNWAREPDLLFVATANLPRLDEARLVGPADLVIEVVSDDSVTRDRVRKRRAYEEAGVPEYWIVDPRPGRREALFLRLGADGRYREAPLASDGRYHSDALPGFWLDPSWLWQQPLPRPQRVVPLILSE
jgi:Uma2 family endonuclease